MQARRAARELALLSLPQLPTQPQNLDTKTFDDLLTAVVRALTEEAKDHLEMARAELQKAQREKIYEEQLESVLQYVEQAINQTHWALEFPLLVQLVNREETRSYAIELLKTVHANKEMINKAIATALVKWELHRLPQIDRDILRLATAEMFFLGIPKEVAINEAVELAKRYSTEDGYRFINAILRKVAPPY
ncbi:MAG: transcription antitermination factor NusB [Pseudanabaenaceae cyanobacterium]